MLSALAPEHDWAAGHSKPYLREGNPNSRGSAHVTQKWNSYKAQPGVFSVWSSPLHTGLFSVLFIVKALGQRAKIRVENSSQEKSYTYFWILNEVSSNRNHE